MINEQVFDLRDGHIVHGPSTYRVTSYATRVRNGMVEVRLASSQQ